MKDDFNEFVEFVEERQKELQDERDQAIKEVDTWLAWLLDWRKKHIDTLRLAESELHAGLISEAFAEETLNMCITHIATIDAELKRFGWESGQKN